MTDEAKLKMYGKTDMPDYVENKTVSDLLAEFFKEKGLRHAFGIVGAGNVRIFNAIARLGYTHIICCHHEQACAQAAIGYYRVSGRISPVLVTCGGGASNIVTGIVSAWMDSIPLFVIAGQEAIRNEKLRAFGVQGFGLKKMVRDVSKMAWQMSERDNARGMIGESWIYATEGRPGPVVIEIPTDIQGQQC